MCTPAGNVQVGRIPESAFLQAGFKLGPVELVRDIGLQGDGGEVDRLVGALHGELAVLELDVALGGFEHMAGDLLGLGLDLVERLEDRGHADRAGARAVGAHAHLHLVGVAVDDGDVLDRDAEAVGHELRESRLVALAVAMRARQDLDRPYRVDAHFGRFPETYAAAEGADRLRRRDAAGLDEGGEADAAQLAFGGGGGLARRHALVVGVQERLVERLWEIAGVVGHQNRRLVRERLDEIDAAELGGVAAGFARGELHQALDDESRLRTAGAAIGVNRRRRGVDAVDLGVNIGNVVLARQQRRIEIGRHGRGESREIAAEVGDGVHAQVR